MKLPFKQVDVFTREPFRGNPVAVVLDAADVAAEDMQRIARWTNLSETTFVLRPSSAAADYRLRIFTPRRELPFAGHPTIGSAHAVVEAGGAAPATLRQECGAGVLPLRIVADTAAGTGGRAIFVRVPTPRIVRTEPAPAATLAAALGVPLAAESHAAAVDVGPVWLVVEIADRRTLAAMTPDLAALEVLSRELRVEGATVFARTTGGGAALAVRSFAPAAGVDEDPVCGSGNAAVAAYLAAAGRLSEIGDAYVATQGTEIGRDGRVAVRVAGGGAEVEIGGNAVTVVDGTITL